MDRLPVRYSDDPVRSRAKARGLNDALNDMTNKLDTRRLGELVVGVQVLRETVTDLEKMLRPSDREQPEMTKPKAKTRAKGKSKSKAKSPGRPSDFLATSIAPSPPRRAQEAPRGLNSPICWAL